MIANRFKRTGRFGLFAAVALSMALSSGAYAQGQAPMTQEQAALRAEQERLCQADAMRLCSSEVPDVERVTVCMRKQKSQLSEPCRAVFDK
jgi:hypothetical protein